MNHVYLNNLNTMSPCVNGNIPCEETILSGSKSALTLANLVKVETIGAGAFGRVDLVFDRQDKERRLLALKVVSKFSPGGQELRQELTEEKNTWASASGSPFVVGLLAALQDAEAVYFVMNACLNGTLYDVLAEYGPLCNHNAQFFTACVVEGLDYLHRQNIVHGDLKSENVILDARGYAKIIDLGLAVKLDPGSMSSRRQGTPPYMAPEVFLQNYNTGADYWALGVLLFEMLTREYLCPEVDYRRADGYAVAEDLMSSISSKRYPCWMDEGAVELISELCHPLPYQRIGHRNGTDEIREHRWFNDSGMMGSFPWDQIKNKTLETDLVPGQRFPSENANCIGNFYSRNLCQDKTNWPEF